MDFHHTPGLNKCSLACSSRFCENIILHSDRALNVLRNKVSAYGSASSTFSCCKEGSQNLSAGRGAHIQPEIKEAFVDGKDLNIGAETWHQGWGRFRKANSLQLGSMTSLLLSELLLLQNSEQLALPCSLRSLDCRGCGCFACSATQPASSWLPLLALGSAPGVFPPRSSSGLPSLRCLPTPCRAVGGEHGS